MTGSVEILQNLIRFNTVNPPGNETECIKYIKSLFEEAGIHVEMIGRTRERHNLIARIKGRGLAPPFLMYGHVDVVDTSGQKWDHPPFEGIIKDEFVWGRGAIDMKSGVAMMVSAMLRMKSRNEIPPGDLIFAALCDEENGGEYGAKYITEKHANMFRGVEYAIGEIGGFTFHVGNKRFYPIMISEKQKCTVRATVRGPGGHGSLPVKGGASAKLGKMLSHLDKKKLPVHITPPVKLMIKEMARHLPFPLGIIIKQMLNPFFTNKILKIMGKQSSFFEPLLHNTVSATIINGASTINVIPSELNADLDGRLLPGYREKDMLNELGKLLGSDVELDVIYYSPGPSKIDMSLFDTLSSILKEGDNEAIPIPYVNAGITDARFFSRLGIQTYGFTPMLLPENINFSKLVHGANERIPVSSLEFGTKTIYKLIIRL